MRFPLFGCSSPYLLGKGKVFKELFLFGADQMIGGHAGTCGGSLSFSSNSFVVDIVVRLRITGASLQPFCEEK